MPTLKNFSWINFREGRITNRDEETKKIKLCVNHQHNKNQKILAWINFREKSKNSRNRENYSIRKVYYKSVSGTSFIHAS